MHGSEVYVNELETVPDFCDYGVEVIGNRLARLLSHTEGARSGQDVHAIHQMRVWSRRTRAALDVFENCFTLDLLSDALQRGRIANSTDNKIGDHRNADSRNGNLRHRERHSANRRKSRRAGNKIASRTVKSLEADLHKGAEDFQRLKAGVKRITRALGTARDLDVMVETLQKRAERLPEDQRAGLESLITHLLAQRQESQQTVTRALQRLDGEQLPDLLTMVARHFGYRVREESGEQEIDKQEIDKKVEQISESESGPTGLTLKLSSHRDLFENSGRLIAQRLKEMFDYEPYIQSPDNVYQLHEMRIAAKRLRYSMEIFEPIYTRHSDWGTEYALALKTVKSLQEHLGALHDADVLVPQILEHQSRLLASGFGALAGGDASGAPLSIAGVHRVDYLACQGLLLLCTQLRTERDARYDLLRQEWQQITSDGVLSALQTRIATVEPSAEPHAESMPDLPPKRQHKRHKNSRSSTVKK